MKARVKFIRGACGNPFRLPYTAGMVADLDPKLAIALIEAGIAETVSTKQVTETATLKKKLPPKKKTEKAKVKK